MVKTAAAKRRKPLNKRLRFEVFKRDSFTCQYCGSQAPDVILHVDHINPVAGGGDNDILNLVTSCVDCNLGKGAKSLDDKSAIAKQRAQLQELSARREQLEMMLNWRKAMSDLDGLQVNAFEEEFHRETGCKLTDHGRQQVRGWLKRFKLNELLDGLEGALFTYYKGGAEDGEENNRLAGRALEMTTRVLSARSKYADKPHMKDLFYIRAMLRNKMHCVDWMAIQLLEEAYDAGIHIDDLKELVRNARSWTAWKETMRDWIDEEMANEPN